ncbi:hypothetical protein [Nodularia sphaerocarpa]|uniref:hypothetical protein n=1 Tax=Nodularia sphaerocarpa TaxID=137816 RepID=UPI001EFB65A3|nr:hypothetical protein [Nodularia sphaerocarpa]MDB9372635.1 hypothetical protein [Nodularia sphaerocarpa CS-585]MDB9378848.1 hypothetical protein [Nodularia sphaerocarpa CS-585A2]ULP71141.1 hypothetical protein BDGGKGIB_00764 [Nodularia sphaerocarpa UHCC 0038]
MANIISRTEYKRTWRQVNQNTQYPDESDPADFINYCPQNFGRGYDRHIQLRGILLLIIDAEFYDDLYIESEHTQESEYDHIEIGFNLSGLYRRKRWNGRVESRYSVKKFRFAELFCSCFS